MAVVRGKVLYDDQPLSHAQYASVLYTPDAGRLAKGKVEPDGTFELSTYEDGDGAIVGPGTLAVLATVDDASVQSEDKYPGVRSVIPEQFGSADTSGLRYEVKPSGENLITIRLTSAGEGEVAAGDN